MKGFDRYSALEYLVSHNPLCENCVRADLEEIRIAAGLYSVVRELVGSGRNDYSREELDERIRIATLF